MPLYLKILIAILVCLAIILCVYMIISFRKMHIVSKKLDYLVEDITYKVEVLTPTIDSLTKLGKFIDIFDSILKDRTQNLIKYRSGNKESIYKVAQEVKKTYNQTKKQLKNKKK